MKVQHLVLLVLIGLLAFASTTRWQSLDKPLVMTDGQGYHAYLPAVFIYQDLQFHFVDSINETYYLPEKRAVFVMPYKTGNVNKYYAGTALVQTPFFVVGCIISRLAGVPVDGYSWPFQLMVGVGAIFCLVMGLFFLGKLLLNLGYGKTPVLITLLLMTFGTNLFYYTVYEPSMSHVYSFFTVSSFLFFARKFLLKPRTPTAFLAAALFGLTVLIRPVNGLIILALPILVEPSLIIACLKRLLGNWRLVLLAVTTVVAIGSIQVFIYWIQTGTPVVWSYEGEGFNFGSPEVVNVLFSYRKGLFVYCPILALAVVGVFAGIVRRKEGFGWLFLVLCIIIWVISSWWMWYYGGSYGHRPFIEFYSLFAIGLVYLLQEGFGPLKILGLTALSVGLVAIQLIQTYQYVQQIMPHDHMTQERYWNIFLNTKEELRWYYSGDGDEGSYFITNALMHDMEQAIGWGNEHSLTDSTAKNGMRASILTEKTNYGITLRKPVRELYPMPEAVKVSAWIKTSVDSTDASFVCAIEDSVGTNYFWKRKRLKYQLDENRDWSRVTVVFKCGRPKTSTDEFVIYPFKEDSAVVFVDDLQVSFLKGSEN